MKHYVIAFLVVFGLVSCENDNHIIEIQNFEEIKEQISQGEWIISEFIDSGKDERYHYVNFTFLFENDGKLIARNGSQNYQGNWSINSRNSGDDHPDDEQYRGRYEGDMFQRDSAYHQGTVWPWPIGAYCEAVLRVGEFSEEARSEVRRTLEPLIGELKHGCVGQLAEVYDGDPPHRPSGCPAQAWSIAEVLRIVKMLDEAETQQAAIESGEPQRGEKVKA